MLARILVSIHRLDDLGRLFTHLGYQPDDHPAGDGLRGVARWRTFRILGIESAVPREAARAAAQRLAGAARPGLIAALGDGALALAVPRLGATGSSPVLAVHTARPSPSALRVLAQLAPRERTTALEHALRLADLLSTEEVGGRFFVAFRAVLERMTAACDPRGTSEDRTLAALLALIRVLFLYFVQAKGWLDGRPGFLRDQLDDALNRRRHFHRSVLHPLFFGTLNRAAAARTHRARFGRMPYLNGGLFEPHPVERRVGPVAFSNAMWRDAFDGLFERFRFCVREGQDAEAIAPDMLGRVFERVMDPGDRQTSGTFYTPEHLVRKLVRATLATSLTSDHLPYDIVARWLGGEPPPASLREEARAALRAARIVDPAVGSGAFLLGALEALAEAWHALEPQTGAVEIRRRVLRESLFGVDVSPIAVQLAELRLWLAVVADDPETDIVSVAPLPNLNGVVRQGDSLLDPVGAARTLGLAGGGTSAAAAVWRARDRLFDACGSDRAGVTSALRAAELAAARDLVEAALGATRAAIADLAAAAGDRDLFGRRSGLSQDQKRRYRHLRGRQRDLEKARRRVADGTVPFFSYEVHRPDVMSGGGFTAVVGNPPWVRAERLPPTVRTALRERFRWWQPTTGRGYGHLPDLAVAFLERCVELAAPDGAVGILVPSKLTSSGYGEPARAALVRETSLAYLHRVPDDDVSFDAAVYPLALVARKRPPERGTRVRLSFETDQSVAQDSLAAPGPWMLVSDRALGALGALRTAGTPLADIAAPALGVKTGADRLLVGRVTRDDGERCLVRFDGRDVPIERRVLRPALRGRDVRAFRADATRVVLWGYDRAGRPLGHLPPLAAAYAHGIRRALDRRADGHGMAPWTLFRLRAATAPWRVVWADIAREPGAIALDETLPAAVPLNTCYVCAAPDATTALAVAGVLNSIWSRALLRHTTDEARGGYRRHNARATAAVPVPAAGPGRNRIATLSRAAHHTGHVAQSDLDRAVADALGLSADVRDALAALARDPR